MPAGGSARPADDETVRENLHTIQMHGQDVYKHACDRMTEAAREVLGDRPLDSVDLVVAHQANGRIVRTVAQRLGLRPDQVIDNIERYGNNSAASIPIALAEAEAAGRLADGMTVLLVAFGAGFSWAAGLVEWGSS
jgi:3-oxoacyl-[acyl-carrier-protein] synthase-3